MPTKLGKNQYVRPSGIVASKDDKYFYWNCSISGTATFANAERFKKVVEKYGSEEILFKTFVCRDTKKLLEKGFTEEQIRNAAQNGKNLMDELPTNIPVVNEKKPRAPKIKIEVDSPKTVEAEPEQIAPKIEEKVVYPWSGNSDYFKSPAAPFNIEEDTKDTCMYSNRYINDMCHSCSIYDKCQFVRKYTAEDWKKPVKRDEVVVKAIKFDKEGQVV